MAVSASRDKSPTFDEVVHITAGYNVWINHDQRFDPGNGDFVKRWATLPLLLSKPNFPPLSGEAWHAAEFFSVSRDFMFHAGNDPDAMLLQTRSLVAWLGVALGLLVFACSRRLFGDRGGFISLAVFVFCPHMLAHGALVSTDLALTLTLLASTWFLWQLLHVVDWPTLIGSLLAFALLIVSKMSAVLIAPIAAVLIVARFLNREPWVWHLGKESVLSARGRQSLALIALMGVHILTGWIAIWTVFEFKYLARADPADTHLVLMRSTDAAVDGPIGHLSNFCHRHRLLPEGYLKGMEELVGISKRRPSFLNGHWKAGGQAWFFPYAFWVKTPPALLALLVLGLAGWAWARRRGRGPIPSSHAARPPVPRLYEAVPLFALFGVYAGVAVQQDVNIGHRHLLPVYPVLYILAGSVALLLPSRKRFVEIAVAVLLGWYAIDSLTVRPHYLAYFSGVAGGPSQGYRRLADSSLDWGQDLPGLKRWLAAHNPDEREPVFFSYFGTGIPDHYGISSQRLPGFPEWRDLRVFAYTPGYYAISATMYQQLYTMTFGPWNRVYEAEYQTTIARLGLSEESARQSAALADVLQMHPESFWQEGYSRFEKLRFARLCAWLRATDRRPDDQVGHSILVWKLDEHALHDALWGAPLELHEAPALPSPPAR